jgi:phosphatidylglycerophosphate synthase
MLRVHPNILTLIGMLINIFAMVLFAKGIFLWAGVVIIVAGIFDTGRR